MAYSVFVQTLNGDELELHADYVSEVMSAVNRIWHVPALCQKLFCNSELMQEERPLADFSNEGTCLTIALIISVETAEKELAGGPGVLAYRKQVSAINTLSDMSAHPRDGAMVLPLLFDCVLHGGFGVVSVAQKAILKLAEKGSAASIEAVQEKLDSWLVPGAGGKAGLIAASCFALEVLGEIVLKGDRQFLDWICAAYVRAKEQLLWLRKHHLYRFQEAVIEALRKLTNRGDLFVIDFLKELLASDDSVPQLSSLLCALGEISIKGDLILRRLMLVNLEARPVPALYGLAHVAERGDGLALDAIKRCCLHAEGETRTAAMKALAKVMEGKDAADAGLIYILVAGLEDHLWVVRMAALQVVSALMVTMPLDMAHAVVACSQDRVLNVRRKAEEVLCQLNFASTQRCAAARHFLVLETASGRRIIAEQLQGGFKICSANPAEMERRFARARVKFTADCTGRNLLVSDVLALYSSRGETSRHELCGSEDLCRFLVSGLALE